MLHIQCNVQNFFKGEELSPVGAEHDQTEPSDDAPRQWTHKQATSSTGAQGNTTYSHGRIDDILIETNLAKKVPLVYTCTNGYHSDHIPLVTY